MSEWRDSHGEGASSSSVVPSSSSSSSTGFPLLPASKGFCISLQKAVKNFEDALVKAEIWDKDEEKEA